MANHLATAEDPDGALKLYVLSWRASPRFSRLAYPGNTYRVNSAVAVDELLAPIILRGKQGDNAIPLSRLRHN
jgi:hypothetical protein